MIVSQEFSCCKGNGNWSKSVRTFSCAVELKQFSLQILNRRSNVKDINKIRDIEKGEKMRKVLSRLMKRLYRLYPFYDTISEFHFPYSVSLSWIGGLKRGKTTTGQKWKKLGWRETKRIYYEATRSGIERFFPLGFCTIDISSALGMLFLQKQR